MFWKSTAINNTKTSVQADQLNVNEENCKYKVQIAVLTCTEQYPWYRFCTDHDQYKYQSV